MQRKVCQLRQPRARTANGEGETHLGNTLRTAESARLDLSGSKSDDKVGDGRAALSTVSTIAAGSFRSEEARLTPRSLPTSARAKKDTLRIVSVRLAFSHEHDRYTNMRYHHSPTILLSQLGTAGDKVRSVALLATRKDDRQRNSRLDRLGDAADLVDLFDASVERVGWPAEEDDSQRGGEKEGSRGRIAP